MLRNRIGGIGGHPEHMDLTVSGPGIHIVESGAAQGNDFHPQLVEPVDDRLVYDIVNEYAHAVKTCGQRHGVFIEFGLKIFDLKVSTFCEVVKAGNIIGLGIKKSNFHRLRSFRSPHKGVLFLLALLYPKEARTSVTMSQKNRPIRRSAGWMRIIP